MSLESFLFNLGLFAGNSAVNMFTRTAINMNRASTGAPPSLKAESAENRRLAGCRDVVLGYAQAFGFIARECITRDELEKLIDGGIEPDALRDEIQRRIDRAPGLVLGEVNVPNIKMQIKLPFSLRDRHMYIIGRSGSGKTNLIRFMALQDIAFGSGIGIVAPEQELITEEIMPYIPEERIDDVVYVNPAERKYPIAFNPLHLEEGEDIGEKVEDFVTIFKRAVGDTGFRMDQILSETLYALIRRRGSTLDDIEPFLSRTNPAFRNEVLQSADRKTRTFFEDTYPSMDKNAASPVLSRISAFTRRDAVRNLLCQPGRSFSFRKAMDEGKILLFNLSDGILGEQASQLLGQIIISQIQLAVMGRADTPAAARRPFYLYLDEFQTFTGVAATSYERLLSRARKYQLGLILAHQQTQQIPQSLLAEIFGNVTTFVAFSIAYDDAKHLSHQYIVNEDGKMTPLAQEEFVNQKVGEAIGKIGQNVFPLKTPLVPRPPNSRRAEYIMERSRQNYGLNSTAHREAKVKRQEPILLPPKSEESPDPSQVF